MSKTTDGNLATTPTALPTTAAWRVLAPVAGDDELDDELDDERGDVPGVRWSSRPGSPRRSPQRWLPRRPLSSRGTRLARSQFIITTPTPRSGCGPDKHGPPDTN